MYSKMDKNRLNYKAHIVIFQNIGNKYTHILPHKENKVAFLKDTPNKLFKIVFLLKYNIHVKK